MKTSIKFLMIVLATVFFALPFAHAEINKPTPESVTTEKLNKMMPSLQNRFCRLKLRPVAVVVILGIWSVEWSIDRICGSKLPEGYENLP